MMNSRNNQWLIDLSKEDIWAEHLESVPAMICYSYAQLRRMAESGQVYGVMLQCKDLYEALYRIPLIMAMIVIESDPSYKEKQGYSDVIRLALEQPMSMGRWNELAEKFISRKNRTLILPEALIKILKRTHELYEEEVSESCSDVVNWRNSAVGHGALKFEDDPAYQVEIRNLLVHLKEYFGDGAGEDAAALYQAAYFCAGDIRLTGDCQYRPEFRGNIRLCVDGTQYSIGDFISDEELKLYLFDSFYSKQKLIRFSSYIDGRDELKGSKYFSDLYDRFVLKNRQDFGLNTGKITREQEQILELLNMPAKYIRPVRLIEMLEDRMAETGHGVISMLMERGTGKSAFANRMSGLFNKKPLIKNCFSRCYHVQNAALRGISDFINALNFNFRHSYDHTQDLYGNTDELRTLTLEGTDPAGAMAAFLNYYHRQYGKEYTILLIDGIDEITEQAGTIMDYIPAGDQLDEGVFILLLSRFRDEKTVQGRSRQYIERALALSDSVIEVHREDEANTDVLRTCIEGWKKEQAGREALSTDELIERADHRFLYLKAYMELPPDVLLDKTDETQFVKSYLEYVMSFYGPLQKQKSREIAVAIALFPQITLKEYQEYMNCMDLTYGFVGMLNDLMPLLSVLHINGEDAYEFADQAYAECVLHEFPNTANDVVEFFLSSFTAHCGQYLVLHGNRNGMTDDDPEYHRISDMIAFYTEGMLMIYQHGKANPALLEKHFRSIDIIRFYAFLMMDRWANLGYGRYLKDKLFDCIADSIVYCLQNPGYERGKAWLKQLNDWLLTPENGIYYLNQYLRLHPLGPEMRKLLLDNADAFPLRDWFWLFDHDYSLELCRILQKQALTDQFIDYIIHARNLNTDCLEKMFSIGHLTKAQEARVLSALVAISSCDDSEQAKQKQIKYLKEMKSKGYSVDAPTVNAVAKRLRRSFQEIWDALTTLDPDTLIRMAEKGQLQLGANVTAFREAISVLQDHTANFTDNSKNRDKVGFVISDLLWNPERYSGNPLVQELYCAYYQRLCYEKEHDGFADFLISAPQLDRFIIGILKANKAEDLIREILKWIAWTEVIIDQDHSEIVMILSRLYIEVVCQLKQQNENEEALLLKAKYIEKWDTKAFFAADPLETYVPYDSLIYCTDNTLSLLKEYHDQGMHEQFRDLLKRIEESVPVIDESLDRGGLTERMCKRAEYRFMGMRKETGVSDEFDTYLESIPEKHLASVKEICRNLTRDSDYTALNTHIYQVLECAWQQHDWTKCIKRCHELEEILSSVESTSDEMVRSILEPEIRRIHEYKEFFEFLTAQDNMTEAATIIEHDTSDTYSMFYEDLRAENDWYKKQIKKPGIPEGTRYVYQFGIRFMPYR